MGNEVFTMLLRTSKKYIPIPPYTYIQVIPDEDIIINKDNYFGRFITFDYCIINGKIKRNNIKLKQNKTYNIYVHLIEKTSTAQFKIPAYTTIYDASNESENSRLIVNSCSSNKIRNVIIKNNIAPGAFDNKTSLESVTIYNTCNYIRDNAFRSCVNIKYFNYVGTPQDWAYISVYTNVNGGYKYLPSHYAKIKFNDISLVPDIIYNKAKSGDSVSLFNNIDINKFDSGLLTKMDNYILTKNVVNKCILQDNITTLNAYSFAGYINELEFHLNHIVLVTDHAFNLVNNQKPITTLNIISEHNDLGCLAYLFNNNHGNPIQKAVINPILVNGIVSKKAITPNDVTTIGIAAFSGLSQLEEVIISDSVITVMYYMCINSKVKYIKYGKSVKTIGNNCCSDVLEVVDFGESVESIGEGSISRANVSTSDNLKAIVIRNPIPPTITENTIRYVSKNIPFYVPDEAVDTYKSTTLWNLFTKILPLSEYDYNDYK